MLSQLGRAVFCPLIPPGTSSGLLQQLQQDLATTTTSPSSAGAPGASCAQGEKQAEPPRMVLPGGGPKPPSAVDA